MMLKLSEFIQLLIFKLKEEYKILRAAALLCALGDYKDPLCVPVQESTDKIIQVGNTVPPRKGFDNPQEGRIYDPQGLSPTLNTRGGNRGGYIIEPKERFFKQAIETLNNNDCKVGDTIDAYNKRVNKTGICPTLTT